MINKYENTNMKKITIEQVFMNHYRDITVEANNILSNLS